jgi:TatD DNase family protein
MRFYDAHAHLQDARLSAVISSLGDSDEPLTVVTNGTCPADWPAVAALEGRGSLRVLKAYGVHPWKVEELPEDWENDLRERLHGGAVSVGEIGLDHWIEPRRPSLQREVFERQLFLAREFGFVPTVHGVRAWEEVAFALRQVSLPGGFLMHAFSGSREVQRRLLDIGGHFSFSAYAAEPSRKRMREAIAYCPLDRLLTETDAPDMVPPAASVTYPLVDTSGQAAHHPLEIRTALATVAALRGEDLDALAGCVEVTFRRLFQ